jgi:1-acyl-sn-glycerol-3-phosphate acyltransferase
MNATAPSLLAPRLLRGGWLVVNTLQLLFTLAFTGGGICIALLVNMAARSRRLPLWMAARCWAPVLLRGAGARLRVEGAGEIDWSQPMVLVCNHQSIIDICALFRAVPVPLRFVLKQELGRVPFLGAYARAMGMVFIDRGDPRRARETLRRAADTVRAGATVVAFAEGTRSSDGRVGAFRGGAFKLAIDAGVPVLPIAISGSGAVLPPSGFTVRPGVIEVRIGRPIATSGAAVPDRHQLATQARDAVVALLSH